MRAESLVKPSDIRAEGSTGGAEHPYFWCRVWTLFKGGNFQPGSDFLYRTWKRRGGKMPF